MTRRDENAAQNSNALMRRVRIAHRDDNSGIGRITEQVQQAQDLDAIPTLTWSAHPDGSAEFLNRRWLEYTGLSAEEALGWGWTAAVHIKLRVAV